MIFAWLLRRQAVVDYRQPAPPAAASDHSVAIAGPNINSPVSIGLDEAAVGRMLDEKLRAVAEAHHVPEAPLRAVLAKLGQQGVSSSDIPARLEAAADELLRLRTDLARHRNERPEFAAIRARASAAIDAGDFDTAGRLLREGRTAARDMRLEYSRTEAAFLIDEARVNRLRLDRPGARTNLEEATALDPDNCWAWIELGDLWLEAGSLDGAIDAYQSARKAAIASGDERDLSVSHNKIGDVQVAQGALGAALESFRASHSIFERLAAADPGNAGWQRDLSVSHEKIGDVQVEQGDLAAAQRSYQASHDIFDRLAQADPANVGWQRDLALIFGRLGIVHAL